MHGRIKTKGQGFSARAFLWFIRASLVAAQQQGPVIRSPFTGVIDRVDGFVGVAPTGANLIVDIRKGVALGAGGIATGLTSIWSVNTGNKLNIVAGTYYGNRIGSAYFDTLSVKYGDFLVLDIAQVGSTVPGSDLTVILSMRE